MATLEGQNLLENLLTHIASIFGEIMTPHMGIFLGLERTFIPKGPLCVQNSPPHMQSVHRLTCTLTVGSVSDMLKAVLC